jgi:hypothetical protein
MDYPASPSPAAVPLPPMQRKAFGFFLSPPAIETNAPGHR